MRKFLYISVCLLFVFGSFLVYFSGGNIIRAYESELLTPAMTSNEQDGIVLTSSKEIDDLNAAWRAFDQTAGSGTADDGWSGGIGCFDIPKGNGFHGGDEWITIKFPSRKVVTKLIMRDRGKAASRFASKYSLWASNDNENWVQLGSYSRTKFPAVSYQKNETVISNDESYMYYRFQVTESQSGTMVKIGEIELYGYEPVVSPPVDSDYGIGSGIGLGDGGISSGFGGGGSVSPPAGGGTVSPSGNASYAFTKEGLYDLVSMGLVKRPDSYIPYYSVLSKDLPVSSAYLSKDYVYKITYSGSLSSDYVPITFSSVDNTQVVIPSSVSSLIDQYQLGGSIRYRINIGGLTVANAYNRGSAYFDFSMVFTVKEDCVFPFGSISSNVPSSLSVFSQYVDESISYCTLEVTKDSAAVSSALGDGLVDFVGGAADTILEAPGAFNDAEEIQENIVGLFGQTGKGRGITFPGFTFTIQGVSYSVWEDVHFSFDSIEDNFADLMNIVRAILVAIVYCALMNYILKIERSIFEDKPL